MSNPQLPPALSDHEPEERSGEPTGSSIPGLLDPGSARNGEFQKEKLHGRLVRAQEALRGALNRLGAQGSGLRAGALREAVQAAVGLASRAGAQGRGLSDAVLRIQTAAASLSKSVESRAADVAEQISNRINKSAERATQANQAAVLRCQAKIRTALTELESELAESSQQLITAAAGAPAAIRSATDVRSKRLENAVEALQTATDDLHATLADIKPALMALSEVATQVYDQAEAGSSLATVVVSVLDDIAALEDARRDASTGDMSPANLSSGPADQPRHRTEAPTSTVTVVNGRPCLTNELGETIALLDEAQLRAPISKPQPSLLPPKKDLL